MASGGLNPIYREKRMIVSMKLIDCLICFILQQSQYNLLNIENGKKNVNQDVQNIVREQVKIISLIMK